MNNALSIDVEDYYMVSAFASSVKFEDWHKYESRVEQNTYRILALLNEYGVRATFFILGWVAQRHKGLVRDIHAAGHEVACHGYNHRLVYDMTQDEFREDVSRAKDILEGITGEPVRGYRAPSYSIIKRNLWALDVLIEKSFLYDSSIFPIRHDMCGIPDACRFPHRVSRGCGEIIEVPPSTFRFLGMNLPVAGGGYLRLYPAYLTGLAIKKINSREEKPAVVYFHPWEIDPGQPRLKGGLKSRFRHYVNLGSTLPKLRHFLGALRFLPLAELAARVQMHA
ncbi:MAG: DUF3473 domain-containing protein [Nitrospiraceae bacterium]|nr:DUF3473 domain-containing protein [Nitrospiraceae bacterium]